MTSRRTSIIAAAAIAFATSPAPAQQGREAYPDHPDSLVKEGVRQGTLTAGKFDRSKIFPGTERDYWVYVPAQYDGAQPACLMVFQDGRNYIRRDGGYRAVNVFDNLIAAGDMPITVGLFINPGVVPPSNENAEARYNRSFEYDSMGDRYARFLTEEMIPLLREEHGLDISDNPDDRALCGASSGAICAFTAAWERPDQFRRVLSTIGTYVGLRDGNDYPSLIRKTEPKPLRVFLQDGSNDLNIYGGDWWMANQTMERALTWAGYEVAHRWGEGGHNGRHATAILPDAMRWLWEGHGEEPVATHFDRTRSRAAEYLVDGAGWEKVVSGAGGGWLEGMAITDDGTLYYTDVPNSKLYKLAPGGGDPELVDGATGRTNGIALGPDGRLYGAASGDGKIYAWDLATGQRSTVGEGTRSNDLVVRSDGLIYYTDPAAERVRLLRPGDTTPVEVDTFRKPNGIALSADQSLLFVAHFGGRFIYSYVIAEDGTLKHKQPYFHLHLPHGPEIESRADGMCSTRDGLLVSATELGVQIFDQPGRAQLILPRPEPHTRRTCYVTFGGPNRQTLYAATPEAIYRRQTKLTGAEAWNAPTKPPKPRL